MTTKLEYLKEVCTKTKLLESVSWYKYVFAITILKDTKDISKLKAYDPVVMVDGLYYVSIVDDVRELVKIVDYKVGEPLLRFKDEIVVDNSWLPSIDSTITTTIGRLIVNSVAIYPSLGKKLAYINTAIRVKDLEKIFVLRVKNDNEVKDSDIRVSEMVECLSRMNFFNDLSTLVSRAATYKLITAPPDMKSKREALLKEYKDQLRDPVKLVELEEKLDAIDRDYLKDDPAAANILNNKSKMARKKLYQILGITGDFTASSEPNVITTALSSGTDTSDETFSKYINDSRAASFSRGASTAKGGYTYKILQRSLSSITITTKECNTTRGILRHIDKSNYTKLVSRYVKVANNWKLVNNTDEAAIYIDKLVEIRSFMYCKTKGNYVCYKCMSEDYKNNSSGITNIAANVSNVILTKSLKAMHGIKTTTTTILLDDLIT